MPGGDRRERRSAVGRAVGHVRDIPAREPAKSNALTRSYNPPGPWPMVAFLAGRHHGRCSKTPLASLPCERTCAMKANPVTWFEIHVKDMPRAKAFYEKTLATKLEKLDTPAPDIDEMLTFPTGDQHHYCLLYTS